MLPGQVRATKPNTSVNFPISLSSRGNFRIQQHLFGIKNGAHPKHAKGLYLISEDGGDVTMLSGLFGDTEGENWVRYSGDIKAFGKRYFFKIRIEDNRRVDIENFGDFWEGLLLMLSERDQMSLIREDYVPGPSGATAEREGAQGAV